MAVKLPLRAVGGLSEGLAHTGGLPHNSTPEKPKGDNEVLYSNHVRAQAIAAYSKHKQCFGDSMEVTQLTVHQVDMDRNIHFGWPAMLKAATSILREWAEKRQNAGSTHATLKTSYLDTMYHWEDPDSDSKADSDHRLVPVGGWDNLSRLILLQMSKCPSLKPVCPSFLSSTHASPTPFPDIDMELHTSSSPHPDPASGDPGKFESDVPMEQPDLEPGPPHWGQGTPPIGGHVVISWTRPVRYICVAAGSQQPESWNPAESAIAPFCSHLELEIN
ncbi:hypothetical protein C8J57DRAFT_1254208 [Mycena rebaudengoi]|nr:hypothetical protein C8J57DRAFT_1254208 [Mycena rebaudengoi]